VENLTDEEYWQFLISFGRNASTYKPAWGKVLADLGRTNSDKKIRLSELAEKLFDNYDQRTLANPMPQMGQIGKKTIMEHKLDEFRLGRINKERAVKEVTENVKGMVAQKFHTLNGLPIPRPFYTLSDDKNSVQLNDSLFNVFADNQNEHLYNDMDSRWDALEIGYSQMQKSFSLDVNLEKEGQEYIMNKEERKSLTYLRPVLSQYQKHTCFYCGLELQGRIHVDHVIPYQAILHNQIWNLVLSHEECNEDKLDFIPSIKFIDKMKQRNEFMLKSDRFLKQLLEKELGKTITDRIKNVDKQYSYAKRKIIRMWRASESYDPSEDENWKKYVRAKNDLL
jgi:hypothetical protein